MLSPTPCSAVGIAGLAGQRNPAGLRTSHGKAVASRVPGDAQHLLEVAVPKPAGSISRPGGRDSWCPPRSQSHCRDTWLGTGRTSLGLLAAGWGKKITVCFSRCAHTAPAQSNLDLATSQEQQLPAGLSAVTEARGRAWAGCAEGTAQSATLPCAAPQREHPPPHAADAPGCTAHS